MVNCKKKVDCLVIGAGVIGLAIARQFALAGKEVVVLERNEQIGVETSFRNSAVLHAGIYYSPQSLKARLCREGQMRLYSYCQEKNIPHQKLGKLIVMTDKKQTKILQQLFMTAKKNGVDDLINLTSAEINALEPQVQSYGGLYSPSTGILNGSLLLKNFKTDIESAGGHILCNTIFLEGRQNDCYFEIEKKTGEYTDRISSRYLINAAGLWAGSVAHNIEGLNTNSIPEFFFAKGNYFKLNGSAPFKKLIYPLPDKAGLGIHATIDLVGEIRFGPDVEWIKEPEYSVSTNRKDDFVREIQKYYPSLKPDFLQPEFAGVRPKILPPTQQPQDFMIQGPREHGLNNLVNLYGMESPGLTACLAISQYIQELVQ